MATIEDVAKWFILRETKDEEYCLTHGRIAGLCYHAKRIHKELTKETLFLEDISVSGKGFIIPSLQDLELEDNPKYDYNDLHLSKKEELSLVKTYATMGRYIGKELHARATK